ncbi:MAG: hypothetical protein QOE53_114 [Pseudonocardiales bacterium]|jgi:hypothetical protein|nr:hypothetical protein [Pseudonocardiales bacterium]MDT4994316.1 hypothetical protein [Actinoplanes sp.]
MTATTTPETRRVAQGGPHLGVLAVVCTVLFLAGLIISTALAGRTQLPPTAPADDILRYFATNHTAVRVGAFFGFGCAVPMVIYAATASARLHNLGVRAPGATIALAGGVLAAGLQAVHGLIAWVLSQPAVTGDPAVVRALNDLDFAVGGPGHVVFLGLLIAGMAVPALLVGLLPRWLAWAGLVLAAVAELSTFALLIDGAGVLLPVGRFLGYAWLITAGFLLPRARRSANR